MQEQEALASRRDRRRAETRERIFEAAMELMAEHGFERVTVEMITERADVGKGTFFNYFGSKEAVVAYYFESQVEIAADALCDAPAEQEPGSAWETLVRIVHLIAERAARSKPFARMLLALTLTNDQVRLANQRVDEAARKLGIELVARAQAARELRADVPPQDIADIISTGYFGALCCWASEEGERGLHEEIDRRLNLLREGLLPIPGKA